MLITAGAPVVAALGAVGLTGRYQDKRTKTRAEIAAKAAEKRETKDAYLAVMRCGRALATARRYREYAGFSSDSSEAAQAKEDVIRRTHELAEATALAEVAGSEKVQEAALKIRDVVSPGTGHPLTANELEDALREFLDVIKTNGN
jgi:threonine synthase